MLKAQNPEWQVQKKGPSVQANVNSLVPVPELHKTRAPAPGSRRVTQRASTLKNPRPLPAGSSGGAGCNPQGVSSGGALPLHLPITLNDKINLSPDLVRAAKRKLQCSSLRTYVETDVMLLLAWESPPGFHWWGRSSLSQPPYHQPAHVGCWVPPATTRGIPSSSRAPNASLLPRVGLTLTGPRAAVTGGP